MKNIFIFLGLLFMGIGLLLMFIGLFLTWRKNRKVSIKDFRGLIIMLGWIALIVFLCVK